VWEKVVLLLFVDQDPHVPCVHDIPFKLLLVLSFFCLNLLYFLFEETGNVVFLADFNLKGKLFLVLGAGDRENLWEFFSDKLSQALCVFATSMDQNYVIGVNTFDKLGRLLAVGVSCKADFFN